MTGLDTSNKQCANCKVFKSVEDFYKAKDRASGLSSFCKPCHKASCRKWQKSEQGREYLKSFRLRKVYGLTVDEYEAMKKSQSNSCAICKISFELSEPHVDHNHSTGKVRGLLCERCNLAIGLLLDNQAFCDAAKRYLSQDS